MLIFGSLSGWLLGKQPCLDVGKCIKFQCLIPGIFNGQVGPFVDAYMVKKMASLREGDGTLLDNCIMMWGSGLEDGNKRQRDNLPITIAGKSGGSINTGRFLPDTKGNQGDLLTTQLSCAGVPLDRPIGIATKQIEEMKS